MSESQLICKECGQHLKRISNTHLMRCSGLTMQEYAYKHHISLEELVLSSVLEQTRQTVTNKTPDEILQIKTNTLHTLQEKDPIKNLTKEEEQIILGSLLGDGYLFQGKTLPHSTYLVLEHGIRQLDYLLWKGKKLERLGAKFYQYFQYNPVKQRMCAYNQVRTSNHFLFGKYAKDFYCSDGKHLSADVLHKIGPLGIAVWYMDDGNYNQGQIHLYTYSFSKEDTLSLTDMLRARFGVHAQLQEDKYGNCIYIPKIYSAPFLKLVTPFVKQVPRMLYKLGVACSTNLIVCKILPLDASHYLTDYTGKCATLHGGRWQLGVSVKGPIDPVTGMVLDYTYLKHVIKTYIIDKWDHHCINASTPELAWRSTTELMSIWIWFTLLEVLPGLHKIKLYETPDSYTEYQGPSLDELRKQKNHIDLQLLKRFQDPNFSKARIRMRFDSLLCPVTEC